MADTLRNNSGQGGFVWRIVMWGGAAALLSLPAIAMQLRVEGVDWGAGDFLVMGVMLATLCGLVELGARLSTDWAYRAGTAVAALAGFLTVWVNLAVGMIGDEGDPANLVFAAVVLTAAIGALLARFHAGGMVLAMLAAALGQGLGAALALTLGTAYEAFLTLLFTLPWLLAAGLFDRAARSRAGG